MLKSCLARVFRRKRLSSAYFMFTISILKTWIAVYRHNGSKIYSLSGFCFASAHNFNPFTYHLPVDYILLFSLRWPPKGPIDRIRFLPKTLPFFFFSLSSFLFIAFFSLSLSDAFMNERQNVVLQLSIFSLELFPPRS